MSRNEILSAIRRLSMSQGFYGRLYRELTNGSEESEEFLDAMVGQNFGGPLDMVLWLE